MAYWIKILYERDIYTIDLDAIGVFSFSSNRRINFWLPDGGLLICIHPQSNPDAYQQVFDYIQRIYGNRAKLAHWIKFNYDRAEYILDLNRITAFSQETKSGRISFWLPDSGTKIILHPQSNFEVYSQVIQYIEQKTGYCMKANN